MPELSVCQVTEMGISLPRVRKVNQTIAALHNRQMALELVRQHGQLSQKQLGEMTQLQVSTLSNMVRELLDKELLRIAGKRHAATPGKKQTLLEINPQRGYALGFGVSAKEITMAIADASGELITYQRFDFGKPLEQLPEVLTELCQDSETRSHLDISGPLLGIGVGLSGVIDNSSNRVLHSNCFNVKNLPLGEMLENTFNVPCFVENDVRAASKAELHRRGEKAPSHLLYYLSICDPCEEGYFFNGVGSCLFINHKAYQGNCHAAGEVNGPLCPNGTQAIKQSDLDILASPDRQITDSLRKVVEWYAVPLAAMADLFDPTKIVLGSNVRWNNRQMLEEIERAINSRIVPIPNRHIKVVSSYLLGHGIAMGAAAYAIQQEELHLLQGTTGQPKQ